MTTAMVFRSLDPVELERIRVWIKEHGATGEPCDECGLPLLEGERSSVATVQTRLGHLFHSICASCAATPMPNIRAASERIMSRFSSDAVAELVMSIQETVN